MKPFLDTGFFLCLVLPADGSDAAWEIQRTVNDSLHLSSLQWLASENKFLREKAEQAARTGRNLIAEEVVLLTPCPLDESVSLARQWQRQHVIPWFLLLSPALAVTSGATHFLSFDPRTRALAKSAGLKLWPEKL